MTFTIEIDEEQRRLIVDSLLAPRGLNAAEADLRHELADLFIDLPNIESKQPGIIHSFAY